MWSYYGRKTKIVNKYPEPIHNVIVEPFAGTAVYSLNKDNWKKQVILIEKYDVIVDLWHYLQQSKPEDILKLPDLSFGECVDDFTQLCKEEKNLIGFCINRGSASPKKTAKKFNDWNKNKYVIASNLHKIKHWDIKQGEYNEFEDVNKLTATWFIDPPYQYGGQYYRHKFTDYDKLAEYCKTINGQVIVCENTKANWLDFKPLVQMQGQLHITTEAIWIK
jgi:hypothetical protein